MINGRYEKIYRDFFFTSEGNYWYFSRYFLFILVYLSEGTKYFFSSNVSCEVFVEEEKTNSKKGYIALIGPEKKCQTVIVEQSDVRVYANFARDLGNWWFHSEFLNSQ